MTSIGVNDDNDIFLDGQNNLKMVTGIEATMQDCAHVAQVRLGELVLATDKGIPYFESGFNNTNPDLMRQSFIEAWLQVPNVIDVPFCAIQITGDTLNYLATIQTTFGQGTLNG